jgi:Ser/Thr protein kinase RdoA (MazF antagonist)
MPASAASLARELAAALAPFGVAAGRLRRPPAGLGRATFLVGPVVIKLAPPEARGELDERLRVLRALRPEAVAVPRPLADEPFELSVGLGWAYRALPGRTARACALDGSREAFGALAGRLDAALERVASPAASAAPEPVPSADLATLARLPDRLRDHDSCGCVDAVARGADAAVARLERIDLGALRRQWLHRDLNDGNVLFDAATGRAGAIDFDGLAVDLLPREVAVPFGIEATRRDGGVDLRRARALLAGYLSAMPLRDEERRAIPGLSLAHWVEGVVYVCSRPWSTVPADRLARYRRKALQRLGAVHAALPALEEACLRAG